VLCRRHGIECVAEQLVVSEGGGLLCMALIAVHCGDCDSCSGGNI